MEESQLDWEDFLVMLSLLTMVVLVAIISIVFGFGGQHLQMTAYDLTVALVPVDNIVVVVVEKMYPPFHKRQVERHWWGYKHFPQEKPQRDR